MEAKTWQDTVLPGHYTPEEFARLKKQAEATWKSRDSEVKEAEQAGMRKVVEWICSFICFTNEQDMPKLFNLWKAQLKIWFKDNPELLKEWGIKE